jgi:prephenate dehydratase
MTHDLSIVVEVILPVRHALLALPGATIADIKTVVSHPQALYQCEGWIGAHGWRSEPGTDTAGSARRVAEGGDQSRAAIASRIAAERYGLDVLAKDIQDIAENYTRFVLLVPRAAFVLGGAAPGYDPAAKKKTSLVFAARHVAGSLYGCLAEFAVRDVSLAKIESRPDRRTPWSYIFYVDVEGDPADARVAQALAALSRHASFVRVLGTYPTRAL